MQQQQVAIARNDLVRQLQEARPGWRWQEPQGFVEDTAAVTEVIEKLRE
jgi:hypothetical protein